VQVGRWKTLPVQGPDLRGLSARMCSQPGPNRTDRPRIQLQYRGPCHYRVRLHGSRADRQIRVTL